MNDRLSWKWLKAYVRYLGEKRSFEMQSSNDR